MKYLAIVFSVLILLGYLALMSVNPLFGFLQPRGGMVMQGISLLLANIAIWVAANHSYWSLNMKFQVAACGWIWLFVQAGSLFYLYMQAS